MARRFYNGAVRQLNTKVQSFPVNLIAGVFGFKTRDYFDIDETDALQPDVDFKS
jgi:LemA protein